MSTINIDEASKRLKELTDEVDRGEEVVITRGDGATFKLVPSLSQSKPRPQFGSARGEVWMSDDFDEPLEEFEAYAP